MWQRCCEVLTQKSPVGCSPTQASSTGCRAVAVQIPVPKAELSTQAQGKGPQPGQDHNQTMLPLHPPAQNEPSVPPRTFIITGKRAVLLKPVCGVSWIVRSYAFQFPFFEAEKYVSYILQKTSEFLEKQFWIKPPSIHNRRGKITFKSMIVGNF